MRHRTSRSGGRRTGRDDGPTGPSQRQLRVGEMLRHALADILRQKHPKEMTIVLQHQFWGLEVNDEHFTVTLSFNGQHERLVVPWASISAFVDPSVQFGLQFSVADPAPASAPLSLPPAAGADGSAPDAGARVVTLDAFRKSDARKK